MTDLLRTLRPARLPPHAERLRDSVREFLAREMPSFSADQRIRSWMGFDAGFSRRLAQRGWVGVTLPGTYGGANLDVFSRFVLVEELLGAGAPVGGHWIADRQSGPLLLRYGTPDQKAQYLPMICRGEAFFCIGMSEPGAGSDLAAVSTRATRTDGGWELTGQKLWTTHAQHCQFMIALVRTAGDGSDRQRGLSQFLIDLRQPGVSVRPIRDLSGDAHFAEVFFDHVRLPEQALVGAEGQGWEQVTAELALERSGPERIYSSLVLLEAWAQQLRARATSNAHTVLLGRMMAHLAALRAMSLAVTARIAEGQSPVVEAALVKDLGTQFEQQIPAWISETLEQDDDTPWDDGLHRLLAYVHQLAPSFSLRGGTREILRGMIARGLGLR
ncbi:MAG: acyl-CoA dehydrogenase [Rhodoferax sp.]|nr:acyl-CoA dehydrogenase [Rhodoferax sp.]